MKTIKENIGDITNINNDTIVLNKTEDENQDNTEITPVTIDEPTSDVVEPESAIEPSEPLADVTVSDAPVDTVNPDTPVDDQTLATTDEIIPAQDDTQVGIPGEKPEQSSDCICPSSSVTVANFFGTLQESVTIVWRFHLKTRKHHIHVSLNDFYQRALYMVDDIIERYQGIYGIVEDTLTNCVVGDGKDEVFYLNELKTFVVTNRHLFDANSEILSAIDDFLGLIDTTIYKITSFCENAVKSFDEFVYEDFNEYKICNESDCDLNFDEEE